MRRVRSREERAAALARGSIRYIMTALITVVVLSVGIRLYLSRNLPERAEHVLTPAPTAAERVETERRLARIAASLDVFRLRHGAYPASLDALVQDGLVQASELRLRAYQESFYYRGTPETYTLYPPAF